jgi:uncharacterized protein (DUF2147 family)
MRGRLAGLLALIALAAPTAGLAGPVGLWATPKYHGRVEVYACGASLCGRIVDGDPIRADPNQRDIRNKDPSLRGRLVKGLVVFQGYAGGPGEWRGGPFYDPQTGDRSITGNMVLQGEDVLVVRGCIGPFCRSERWKRVR